MRKRIIALIMAVIVIATNIGVVEWMNKGTIANASEATENENITWNFDETTGRLSITGTGEMQNYSRSSDTPWYEYQESVTSLEISEGITHIGASSFAGMKKITSVNIPKSVETIGKSAFSGCSGLAKLDLGSVKTIERTAFNECVSLTELDLPETLTFIGDSFIGCTGLTEVTIPKSVTIMKGQTFGECKNLRKVTIKNPELECEKYSYWYELGPFNGAGVNGISIILPEGMKKIPYGLCNGCPGITSIDSISLPDSILEIGKSAFARCANLESFTIPQKVTVIEESTFAFCGKLKEIDFSSVTKIERTAFEECVSLTKLDFPETLTFIGDSFIGCTGLTEVTIPASVTTMKGQTFGSCTNINKVTILSNTLKCEKYSYWYEMGPFNGAGKNGIHVTFPEGMTEIPYGFFYGCPGITSLSNMTIPESVTSIASNAFKSCSNLETVDLPENITSIGKNAFQDCEKLLKIDCPIGLTEIGEKAFESEQVVLYVYRDSYSHTYAEKNNIPYVIVNSLGEISLDIAVNAAVYQGETAAVKAGSLSDYDVSLYNETKGIEIPIYVARFGVIMYDIENCNANDEIIVTLTNNNGTTTNGNAKVKLDELFAAEAKVTVDELGYAEFGFNKSEAPVRILCFNDKGELVATNTANKKEKFVSKPLQEGEYKFVFTSSYSMCWNVNRFSDFEKFGYVENKNFIVREMRIKNTVIIKDNLGTIPVLEADLLNAFDYTSSMIYIDDSMYEASGYVEVTVKTVLDKKYTIEDFNYINLKMVLPDGSTIVGDAISLNGDKAGYDLKKQTITVKENSDECTLRFCLTPSDDVENWVEAYVEYSMGENKRNENIGNAMIPTSVFQLHVPNTLTSEEEISLWGKAPAKQVVNIYDNGVVIGSLKSNNMGHFSGNVVLHDTENVLLHKLVAKVENEVNITSNEVEVRYMVSDEACVEIVKAEMTVYNEPTKNHKDYSVEKYDMTESFNGTKITKWIWRTNNHYRFEVKFNQNDLLKKVYVVGSDGEQVRLIEATYDSSDDKWIASGKFDENNPSFVPEEMSVTYIIKPEIYAEHIIDAIEDKITVEEKIDGNGEVMHEINGEKVGLGKWQVRKSSKVSRMRSKEETVKLYWKSDNGFVEIAEVNADDLKTEVSVEQFSDLMKIYSLFDGEKAGLLETLENIRILVGWEDENEEITSLERSEVAISLWLDLLMRDQSFGKSIILGFLEKVSTLQLEKSEQQVEKMIEEQPELDFSSVQLEKSSFWDSIVARTKNIKDPSGYVYECVEDNRIEGVKTTIYYQDSNGQAIEWDASEYEQKNPLYTNELGEYEWYVPEGLWQVKYEKEGYETTYSEWLPVPPPQTEVNIGMKSLAEPQVSALKIDEEMMVLEFEKYMDTSSVCNSKMVLTDENGNEYQVTLEPLSDEFDYEGKKVEKQFVLKAEGLTEGKNYKLTIDAGVSTYAGVKSSKNIIKEFKYVFAPYIEVEQTVYEMNYGETLDIPVKLLNFEEGENYSLTSGETFDKNGEAVIHIDVDYIGEYELDICLTTSNHAKTVLIRILDGKDKFYNHSPHILTNELWTEVEKPLDLKNSIEVFDYEDGKLNNEVEILEENVDYSKEGQYEVEYYVKDQAGNSILKSVVVYVNETAEKEDNDKETGGDIKEPEDEKNENMNDESVKEEQNKESLTEGQNPNTGDDVDFSVWLGLLLISSIGMLALIALKKKVYSDSDK